MAAATIAATGIGSRSICAQHFHIIAPDLRGHGDSDWAVGSGYSMIDYVLDLVAAHERGLQRAARRSSVTRSAAESFCNTPATHPDAVKRVVSIEGMGPPPGMIKDTPAYERMNNWIGQMQTLARRKVREYPSIEEALARMRRRPIRI